jgi:predicted SprT family Zn-dependent metalloprotease
MRHGSTDLPDADTLAGSDGQGVSDTSGREWRERNATLLPLEEHPVLRQLLEATAHLSGASLASDLRLALRGFGPATPRVRSSGLEVPVSPPLGNEEGLAILRETATRLDTALFNGKTGVSRVEWSTRIFRIAGRAYLGEGFVELSWRLYCEVGLLAIAPILAHELIHLWLHRRHRSADHTPEFAAKSRELGLPEMSHALRIDSGGHRYRCPRCSREIVRHAKVTRPLACARCCDELNRGRFDPRFAVVWIGRDEPRHEYYSEPLTS